MRHEYLGAAATFGFALGLLLLNIGITAWQHGETVAVKYLVWLRRYSYRFLIPPTIAFIGVWELALGGLGWGVGLYILCSSLLIWLTIGWRSVLGGVVVLVYGGLLLAAWAYAGVLSSQVVWLLPQLALMGVVSLTMAMLAKPDGQPRYGLVNVPLWLGLLLVAAMVDTVFGLSSFTGLLVIWDLQLMPTGMTYILDPSRYDSWTALLYGGHPHSLGLITSYIMFMFMGVMAYWAKELREPVLVVLPIMGWIVGALMFPVDGLEVRALPMAAAIGAATYLAAELTETKRQIFWLLRQPELKPAT